MKFHNDYPRMPLVNYQEIIESLTEEQPLLKSYLSINHKDCDYCGRKLRGKRLKQHINICQKTTIHNFCSKDCKNMWCFDIQKGT